MTSLQYYSVVRIFSGSADFNVLLNLASNVISLKSAFTATVLKMFSGFCWKLFSPLTIASWDLWSKNCIPEQKLLQGRVAQSVTCLATDAFTETSHADRGTIYLKRIKLDFRSKAWADLGSGAEAKIQGRWFEPHLASLRCVLDKTH